MQAREELAPSAGDDVPTGQKVHAEAVVAPGVSLKLPAEQGLQASTEAPPGMTL